MKEKQYTQAFLAEHLGVTQAAVSKWINGSTPTGETLVKIANLFGVTVERLLFGARKPVDPSYEFLQRVETLATLNGWNLEQCLAELDISAKELEAIKTGKSGPSDSVLHTLSDLEVGSHIRVTTAEDQRDKREHLESWIESHTRYLMPGEALYFLSNVVEAANKQIGTIAIGMFNADIDKENRNYDIVQQMRAKKKPGRKNSKGGNTGSG